MLLGSMFKKGRERPNSKGLGVIHVWSYKLRVGCWLYVTSLATQSVFAQLF